MSFWKKSSNKHSNRSLPLVAMDMGSGTLRAIAAEPTADGRFRILGVESLPYDSRCVERGVVTQPSGMAFQIKKIIKLLSHRIGVEELPRVLISWGCQGITFTDVTIRRKLQNRAITQHDLDDWNQECIEKCCNSRLTGFGAVPHYFINDKEPLCYGEPELGARCNDLRILYHTFMGPKQIQENTYTSFNTTKSVQVENAFLRSEALLSAFIATDSEIILDEGCAVLDFGAETTTLFIYKGSSYLFYQVFEQGGADITEHLSAHFDIPLKDAEWMKCKHGVACPDYMEGNKTFTINYADGSQRRITSTDIAEQIEVVLKTTLAPISKCLMSHEDKITRLYITGGGSMLRGLDQYLQAGTSLQVLYGSHEAVLVPDSDDEYYHPTYSALIGTLMLGQDERTLRGTDTYSDENWRSKLRNTVRTTVDTAVDIFSGTGNDY